MDRLVSQTISTETATLSNCKQGKNKSPHDDTTQQRVHSPVSRQRTGDPQSAPNEIALGRQQLILRLQLVTGL